MKLNYFTKSCETSRVLAKCLSKTISQLCLYCVVSNTLTFQIYFQFNQTKHLKNPEMQACVKKMP